MPMSTASVGTLKTAGERIGPIWQRGGLLLWSLTSACSVTLLALLAGALWQADHAEELLTSYGSSLALAILLLTAFSALMTCVERSTAQQAGCRTGIHSERNTEPLFSVEEIRRGSHSNLSSFSGKQSFGRLVQTFGNSSGPTVGQEAADPADDVVGSQPRRFCIRS